MELFNQYTTMVERCIETKLKQAIPDFDLGDFMAMVEERKVRWPMGSDAEWWRCQTRVAGIQLSHRPCHPPSSSSSTLDSSHTLVLRLGAGAGAAVRRVGRV